MKVEFLKDGMCLNGTTEVRLNYQKLGSVSSFYGVKLRLLQPVKLGSYHLILISHLNQKDHNQCVYS